MKYENRTKHPLPAKILLSLVPCIINHWLNTKLPPHCPLMLGGLGYKFDFVSSLLWNSSTIWATTDGSWFLIVLKSCLKCHITSDYIWCKIWNMSGKFIYNLSRSKTWSWVTIAYIAPFVQLRAAWMHTRWRSCLRKIPKVRTVPLNSKGV